MFYSLHSSYAQLISNVPLLSVNSILKMLETASMNTDTDDKKNKNTSGVFTDGQFDPSEQFAFGS